ncbi:MAG: hypothetical protein ACTTI7_08280 [Gemella haemolysans]|uniref:hypothetical protein n=1 Tax=Gemella haemolysans TaxID=1379 RepID=UPI003F9FC8F7
MKKKVFVLALTLMFSAIGGGAYAAHQTVEYGGSWEYGRAWKYAYSHLASSWRWHSSSTTGNGNISMSGDTAPGYPSYSSITIYPWQGSVNYYYNIW